MSAQKRLKRKKVFVNSRLQGRMLTRIAMYWMLYHVVLWNAMFLCRYLEYRESVLSGAGTVSLGDLYLRFSSEHISMILCAAALSPIILWDMLKLTHRVAGPMMRIEQALRNLADGKPVPKIAMRRGDLPTGLQGALNHYLETLSRRANCFGRPASCEAGEGSDDRVLAELQEIHAMLAGHPLGEPTSHDAAADVRYTEVATA